MPRTCSLPSNSPNVRTRTPSNLANVCTSLTSSLRVHICWPICKRTYDAKVRTIRDIAAFPSRKENIDNKERASLDGITLLVEAPVWSERIPMLLAAPAPPRTGWVTNMVAVVRVALMKAAARRPLRPPHWCQWTHP